MPHPQTAWTGSLGAALLAVWLVGGSGTAAAAAALDSAGTSKPTAAAPPLPASVDLRPEFEQWNLPRGRQGSRPTCSAFTVAGALEFAIARRQGHGAQLSVEFLNWAANRGAGDTNDGGFFSDLWNGFAAYGICTAETLPYAPIFNPAARRTQPAGFQQRAAQME